MSRGTGFLVLYLLVGNLAAQERGGEPFTLQVDTLDTQSAPRQTLGWNNLRTVGIGILIVGGSLAWISHRAADARYQSYVRSGNLEELDQLFVETEVLDRITGWSFAGAQLGLLLIIASFDLPPPDSTLGGSSP